MPPAVCEMPPPTAGTTMSTAASTIWRIAASRSDSRAADNDPAAVRRARSRRTSSVPAITASSRGGRTGAPARTGGRGGLISGGTARRRFAAGDRTDRGRTARDRFWDRGHGPGKDGPASSPVRVTAAAAPTVTSPTVTSPAVTTPAPTTPAVTSSPDAGRVDGRCVVDVLGKHRGPLAGQHGDVSVAGAGPGPQTFPHSAEAVHRPPEHGRTGGHAPGGSPPARPSRRGSPRRRRRPARTTRAPA